MNIVTLYTSSNVVELYRMKAILEEHNIPSHIEDEHTNQWFWHLSNAIGGAKLKINSVHLNTANELLFSNTKIDPKKCPQCSSEQVFFDQFHKSISIFLSLFISLTPFPIYKNKWSCRDCGYKWKEKDKDTTT